MTEHALPSQHIYCKGLQEHLHCPPSHSLQGIPTAFQTTLTARDCRSISTALQVTGEMRPTIPKSRKPTRPSGNTIKFPAHEIQQSRRAFHKKSERG
eukprot:1137148-Pelagomonas_calceolata.AAC.5